MGILHNIGASLPDFTGDPVDRLAHTLAAYSESADDAWAVEATRNVVPGHDTTGLTWGDLRALLVLVKGVDAVSQLADRWSRATHVGAISGEEQPDLVTRGFASQLYAALPTLQDGDDPTEEN
ncbi:hypothetical protein [Nocardia farcinica]|uniref:hypothetical protein n=1 Tax=Nocardia farcinica TaxID=37329 RepID=UPI0024551DB6|nr:hypothetical protein [Nocardia farcinica]